MKDLYSYEKPGLDIAVVLFIILPMLGTMGWPFNGVASAVLFLAAYYYRGYRWQSTLMVIVGILELAVMLREIILPDWALVL